MSKQAVSAFVVLFPCVLIISLSAASASRSVGAMYENRNAQFVAWSSIQEYGSTAPSPSAPFNGYDATPSGYGANPPGYDATPPGYGVAPKGYDATLPGYGVSPPGYDATPPGYGAAPKGYDATPPGYDASPPGYGATPPGYGTSGSESEETTGPRDVNRSQPPKSAAPH